ncbi:MAG: response regulator, partial [Gammaproteobacteria bacterium]
MTLTDDVAALHREVPGGRQRILVVDDELLFAKAVARRLQRAGFSCSHAPTLAAARAALTEDEPDLVLLDMRLPDGSGLDFLRKLRDESALPVIVMTAYGEVEDAVQAMKFDASDYLKKPLDLEELLLNVEKVLHARELDQRLEYSRTREHTRAGTTRLIGESAALVAVRDQVERIAALARGNGAPPTVLITGE